MTFENRAMGFLGLVLLATANTADRPNISAAERLILVVGAPGEDEFGREFGEWSKNWLQLAEREGWEVTRISGQQPDANEPPNPEIQANRTDSTMLKEAIENHQGSEQRLWIVLLGHGTFTRNVAKFNLVGPDVSAPELNQWLRGISSQVVIVNCSSASGPFVTELGGPQRILLTATRSGSELNYSRYGRFLSMAINDLSADIDHDNEVSLLEAFLLATAQTERFYREEARLTTEHALLDDNGDRVGTAGDFFQGIRPVKAAPVGKTIDGNIAGRIILFSPSSLEFPSALSERRTQIEDSIEQLRQQKSTLSQVDFYARLERLLLELADVYDQVERL